ncbi:MAG: DEAD/DEAH box helicase [Gemmatimonadaceae bacterium]|jgi:ATP-dependent RNA helicase DeaD|nr:DEAD/DEAH box helicase [Gemmatimonadaceae bacterium]
MASHPDVSSTDAPGDGSGFAALGLDPRLVEALVTLGYEEPSPVQRSAIPTLLAGRDVLAQAATGTGKTAAFALPLLHRMVHEPRVPGGLYALVLVPTRELAMQVAEAIHRYGRALGVRVLPLYGGAPMEPQLRALKRGVDVVVATPGRALDHLRRQTLSLATVHYVVLDEADEMLDMGFAEDMEALLDATPGSRQTALFSATLPPRIASIAERQLSDPEHVTIAREVVPEGESARVRQVAYLVGRAYKMPVLGRILDVEQPTATIVFCRTRTEVDELTETLAARGVRADALHGGLSQDQRDRVMKRFRAKRSDLLIATDVAARGLDVQHVTHVVNFDVPTDPAAYVHRIGRTGRAGREGVAITLAEPREHRLLRFIERVTGAPITIEPVPTVEDLRARRLETTRTTLRTAIEGAEFGSARDVVASLASEFDIFDVAAAAVSLLDARRRAEDDETEIPTGPSRAAQARVKPSERGPRATESGSRGDAEHSDLSRTKRPAGDRTRTVRPRNAPSETARIWIGGGRKAKIRPTDLVGAIAGETRIDAKSIGAIVIADRHATVEVPRERADEVIAALAASTIKGRRLPVRRDRAGA